MRPRIRMQFGTLPLLLLLTLAAVWVADSQIRSASAKLKRDIPPLRKLARVLSVRDESQFASIILPITWPEEINFRIYVPANGKATATLELDTPSSIGLVVPTVEELPPGKHDLQLFVDLLSPGLTLRLDGKSLAHSEFPEDLSAPLSFVSKDLPDGVTEQTSLEAPRTELFRAILSSAKHKEVVQEVELSLSVEFNND